MNQFLFEKKQSWILGGFEYLRADTTAEADPGSGGALFAVDANGTTVHPYAKMEFGASGTQTPVSAANPLPVVQTGTPGLPTGAATAANQSTANTSLATLAGAVAGTEVQVDVLTSALPTGAATAAKQPALGTAGTASTDVISVQGIASMTPLLVDGSAAAQPVTDNSGSLTVDFTGQKTSDYDTGAGTDTVLMAGIALPASGGAVAGGTATNPLRTDPTGTTAQPVTDNAGSLTVDSPQLPAALGQLAMAASVSVALASDQSALPVSLASVPSHAVTNAGTFAVQNTAATPAGTNNIGDVDIASIAAGDNNIGNVDIVTVPTDPFGANADAASATGSISAKLRFMAETGIPVTGTVTVGSHAVTNAGAFAVQAGQAAHDAAIAGNPVRIGGRAVSADVTAVATGDTADLITDLNGKQIVLPYAIPENMEYGVSAAKTDTNATEMLAAAGAGIRHYITSLSVVNSHATVGTVVEIRDGTTTVIHRGYAAPVGGGYVVNFPVPLRCTANTAVNAYNITTGSNTYISLSGYKAQ